MVTTGEPLDRAPGDWRSLALSRVTLDRCDGPFGSGLTSAVYTDQGRRVVRLQNIGSGEFLDTDRAFIDEAYYRKSLGDHGVQAGDLLIAGLGDESHPAGRACVAPDHLGAAMVKADCFRFRLNRHDAMPQFLAYQLSATADAFAQANATGTTRSRVNLTRMAARRIVLPSIGRQRIVVDFLDRATSRIYALVSKKQQLIELLQEKRAALISHAVTKGLDPDAPMKDSGIEWLGTIPSHWRALPLRRGLVGIEQGWSPDCDNRPAEEGEWGVLKAGCVNRGVFVSRENKALPAGLEPRPELEVRAGDILMSRASGSTELVGSVGFVTECRRLLMLSDKVFRLHPRSSWLDAEYLALAMNSRLVRSQIESVLSGSVGLARNIGQSTVRDLIICYPPPDEQRKVARALNWDRSRTLAIQDAVRSAVDRLNEYRSALIAAAVTGQIDVRTHRLDPEEVLEAS